MYKCKLVVVGYLRPAKLVMSRSLSTQTALEGSARVVSKTHLKTGDPLPELRAGFPWLFSAKLSPFSHRVRLVFATKGISYDEINCNLGTKPEFLVERNPSGKVPVLEINGKVITESRVISELIEELYPDPPLYPKDPFDKAQDRVIVEMYTSKVQNPMMKAIFTGDMKAAGKLMDGLGFIERELVKRGTPFFGGQEPGMVDLMIWPFNERLVSFDPLYDLGKAQLPNLVDYVNRMESTPAVKATASPKEMYLKIFKGLAQSDQYDYETFSSKL
ncbi:pyrimidodiazepine synthase-like [Patiria miniata]|uniref:Glutathione S-transferase omega n=1 Tax=Patiria miniata TaxID=46514 RepID=A0A914B297_PATMI|nr:pyrimidodiazepine synthase-like [Patiria miniata]